MIHDIYLHESTVSTSRDWRTWHRGAPVPGEESHDRVCLANLDLAGLVYAATEAPFHKLNAHEGRARYGSFTKGFESGGIGPEGVEEYIAAIDSGYPEGAKDIQHMLDSIKATLPVVTGGRRRRKMGDDGDELDVDRYYGGEYETMFASYPRQLGIAPRVIDLGFQWNASGNVAPKQFHWTGLQFVVLADLLETAGYRCRIRLLAYTYGNGDGHDIIAQDVCIKEPQEPVQIDKLALVALPQTFRRLSLNADCTFPAEMGWGLGKPMYTRGDSAVLTSANILADLFPLYYRVPDLIIPVAFSERAVRESIDTVLKQCGLHEDTLYLTR